MDADCATVDWNGGVPLVAAIVALACVAGCGGAPASKRPTVTVAFRTVTVAAAPVPRVVPTDASAPERAAASTPPATSAHDRRANAPAPVRTDDTEFWRLIAQTRSAADNDTGRQSGLLEDRLTELSPQAIIEFARTRHRPDERAYTWRLWGAASVIEDGCSEDCFRDFRSYLISLGRGPYENATKTLSKTPIRWPRSPRVRRRVTGRTPTTLRWTPTRA
jgi:hypothetical protein